MVMARENEFQWTQGRLLVPTRENLDNLCIIGVEPRIKEYEYGNLSFWYFFQQGCAG